MIKRENNLNKRSKKIKLLVNPSDLKVINFSKEASEFFELSRKKTKNILLTDLIGKSKSEKKFREIIKAAKEKNFVIDPIKILKPSKNKSEFSLLVKSIKYEEKKLLSCTFTQLNEKSLNGKNQAEDASGNQQPANFRDLIKDNKKLRTIFQNNPLMIFIVDGKGKIKELNSPGAKELGYEINELVDHSVKKVFLRKDWKIVKDQIQKCIKNPGKMFSWEIQKVKKDKGIIWVRENARTIESNGKPPEVLIVCENITKLKEAEKSVIESSERIRQIVDASPYGVHVYNLRDNGDLIFTGYNSAADKILGFDHSRLLNKKIEEAFPNLINTNIPNIYRRIARKGSFIENELVDYEDERIKGAYDVSAIQLEPGKIAAFFSDITEKQRAFDELEKSELKFKSLFEFANDAIFIMDSKIFIDCNKKTLEIFGCRKEDIIGKTPIEFSPERQADGRLSTEKAAEKIRDTLNGLPQRFEWKHNRLNGELFDAEVSLNKIILGNQTLLQAIVRDITERKKAEEALRESEERFSSLIHNMIEAALIIDWNGEIIFANNSAAKLVGLKDPSQGIGKKVFDFLLPDFSDIVIQAINRIKVNPTPIIDEYKIQKINGEELWVESLGSKIIFSDKEYILVTLRDVTIRKNTETQLREAKEKAEEMSKLKSNFLANMSHEIRTPLVGILGFAELLKEKLTEKQNLEMADRILISANRLMDTLNLLLDLSRIEARKVDLNLQPYRIPELVESQVLLFEAVAERKNLFLNTEIKDQNLLASVDEQIFRQIINNLINNALKYTYTGGVTVIVDSIEEDSKPFVEIKVRDTGIGIPEDSLGLIFQEFRQVSEGFNRHFEGTGLGLTITKNFVETMNGKINVMSTVGSGSTFTILFPKLDNYQEVEIPKLIEINSVTSDVKELKLEFKPKVLIVENDSSSIDIIRLFIKDLCNVESTDNGEKAFRLVNENDYDLILMDINLGKGMSGTETTKEIRKIEKYKNTPIVAITGFAMRGDREEFLKSGCTHYLSKPFSKGKLLKLLSQIFTKEET
jgi:PAS domain S-box-containing protein